MKKLLLLTLTVICLQAKAQFINLPDSNLRNALIAIYPTIFNTAKQMDTVKAKALKISTAQSSLQLSDNNISNLNGIEFIGSIMFLDVSRNPITTFNKLPFSCTKLTMGNCGLTSLPAAITNSTKLYHLDISQLTTINPNSITDFSLLPKSVTTLILYNCGYTQIPILPMSIRELYLSNNSITNIPSLPDSLVTFYCENNLLTSLPTLPPNLKFLSCDNNNLTNLPLLPSKLTRLSSSKNKISGSLPPLPPNIDAIYLDNNLITSLPALPNSLVRATFSNNLIASIPNIPENFELLVFNSNSLTSIPNIPRPNKIYNDRRLFFSNNNITTLPNIPVSDSASYSLDISYNPISTIADLFKLKLFYLNISGLPINTLVDTISINGVFLCNHNKLRKFPIIKKSPDLSFAFTTFDTLTSAQFPDSLSSLDISYSNIINIPNVQHQLIIHGRPDITCLPKLVNGVFLLIDTSIIKCFSNPISSTTGSIMIRNTYGIDSLAYANYKRGGNLALPNRMSFLPPCNPTNNANNCASFPNIIGSIYVDENNNNTKDPTEPFKANVPVQLKANNKTVTNANGSYVLMADSIGSQTLTVTAPRFYTAVPTTQTFNFSKYDTLVNVPPIALQKTISKDSLAVKITPIMWAARPGFPYPFLVQYENVGSNTVNANINLTYNTSALDYDSSSTTLTPTAGNLQLVRNSFAPSSQGAFVSYFKVKPSAALLGTNLKTWASISGGSALATDTTRRIIGGSYDPNDKLATPQLTTTQVAEGQFINYTIRFQNTGTDTAFTVVIADTLNSLLQANTFEMLGSSHNCKTIIQDNKIYFEFRNILLPDSTTNLIGSNGFVNFRIKPVSSVALNTSIPNKAAIYFDYNEPIITNTASTLISNTILPLQLVRFTVLYQQGSGVLFNWETKNEQAVKEFVVEESKDAINFKALQQTNSKGNGDNNYYSNANYTATEMVGSKYYRLKTVSSNGNIGYSQIVKLNFDKSILPFIILQNPVKGSLQIQVNAQSLNNTEALLINQEGKVVQGFRLQLGSQTIALSSLGAGVYTLKTKEGSSLVVVTH